METKKYLVLDAVELSGVVHAPTKFIDLTDMQAELFRDKVRLLETPQDAPQAVAEPEPANEAQEATEAQQGEAREAEEAVVDGTDDAKPVEMTDDTEPVVAEKVEEAPKKRLFGRKAKK